ncbi:MAG: LytTR family DNA-binding domain-containing protein [Cytophagales bacterium]|nr:LytTR family DNA-binding domain-containing protein [Cytophagales bacterium]
MKLNCVIIEDEPLARNLLTDYVKKVPSLNLVNAFSNPLEALEALRTLSVDILFLDVQMPEITGITLLKVLKNRPMVVLTTAYSEYALEGYELDVADYLLKPITFERFLKSVDKITQRLESEAPVMTSAHTNQQERTSPFVFVKDGTKLVKVWLDEIRYVEGLKDYVTIHTKDQKITTLQRMKALEEQLPADQFIRIHNSFIVALAAVDVIQKNEVMIGEVTIPIGDTYRKAFKEFIDKKHIQ